MSVVAKGRQGTTVIDLDGSQGNAFVLLGIAGQTMRKSGFDKKTQDSILNEMKSGDYINLLKTFENILVVHILCRHLIQNILTHLWSRSLHDFRNCIYMSCTQHLS